MAPNDLPCDGDGICMKCRAPSSESDSLLCRTCATPWHVPCLAVPPARMEDAVEWLCPDCSPTEDHSSSAADGAVGSSSTSGRGGGGGEGGGDGDESLIAAIRAIEKEKSLTEKEKAKKRQALVSGGSGTMDVDDGEEEEEKKKKGDDVMTILDESFNCSFCMRLPERPITTPCGHNFCLKCFEKWIGQGKLQCANCRASIPHKFASQPRINSTLVVAIRMAKSAKSATARTGHVYHFMRNDSRPEKAFTTERAKKAGKANACSGQIFVTVPPDHFGPIPAENDPKMNRGLLVGDSWDDRFECRQWGAHLPHVAGIAGQSKYGAQSVALSGGYEDDEDHGEWFLYTGRSFKEKRSSYAPEKGVRYDGVYRIEKCWQKIGIQGFKVCRYLFVRCDNEPAPWTSDEHGDRPRPLPVIKELKGATEVTERKGTPSWDYDEAKGWTWMKPPPISRSPVRTGDPNEQRRVRKAIKNAQNSSIRERLLKEFSCLLCRKVMVSPLTTPCGHNFCKYCLMGAYSDPSFVRERGASSGRSLRAKKIVKKCPSCPVDISDFLQNTQVNRELMDLIESLKRKSEEDKAKEKEVVEGDEDGDSEDDDDGIDDAEEEENQDDIGDAGSEKLSEISSVEDKKSDVDPNVSQYTELEEGGREGEAAPWKRSKPDVQDQSVTRKRTKAHAPKQSPKKAKTSSNDDRDDSPSSPLSVPAQDD